MERNNKLAIDNARIIFKNFTGKDDKFGREGDRSFSIVIEDDALAEQLANDGWNVKPLTPRDPDEKVNHFIKVKISFRVRPPKIWLLTNHKRTLLDEDTIATLQYARIENADVVVSPWRWEVNGKTGIAAYLETLYVKIEDDPFADKYADYESSDEVPF
ncbi:hypothetical protein [Gemmiger formicilis]|jgi:hypothetical protein|uniref:hypothetical protein n=1 Tax=Gemmiger formicilis TaxID=745368 RepID=UPI003FD8E64C